MNNKVVIRVVALILVVLMVLGALSAAFQVLAAEAPTATSGTMATRSRKEQHGNYVYTNNTKISSSNDYVVMVGATLWVEEGVTLTVEGNLEVQGTIKNDGIIIVTGIVINNEEEETYPPGTLSNYGTVVNNGIIRVEGGSIYNYPRAEFQNKGKLYLSHSMDKSSLFHNMTRLRGEVLDVASLYNTGTICVLNTEGTGLNNYNGALVDNQGRIEFLQKGSIKGKITGKEPVLISK